MDVETATPPGRIWRLAPHLVAAAAALTYAWRISQTDLVNTAVQFVSPLAVIILTHWLWQSAAGGYAPGYARAVLGRTVATTFAVLLCVVTAAIVAPTPAEANVGDTIGVILGALVCLAVIAAVLFAIGALFYFLGRGVLFVVRAARGGGKGGPPDSRLHDGAAILIVLAGVGLLSLEGTRSALTFAADERAASSHLVKASAAQVWAAASAATSPEFPLPLALRSIPQPVKIVADEGLDLGARRVVLIAGREGAGELTMRIARRTATEATFEVVSDASPVAMWVTARALTFRVETTPDGVRLTVASEYDRLLAPAWFFRPFMGVAAHLAVDTLARDVRQRAEDL